MNQKLYSSKLLHAFSLYKFTSWFSSSANQVLYRLKMFGTKFFTKFDFLIRGSIEKQKQLIYFIYFEGFSMVSGTSGTHFFVHVTFNEPLTLLIIADRSNNINKSYDLIQNSSGIYCSFEGIWGNTFRNQQPFKTYWRNYWKCVKSPITFLKNCYPLKKVKNSLLKCWNWTFQDPAKINTAVAFT